MPASAGAVAAAVCAFAGGSSTGLNNITIAAPTTAKPSPKEEPPIRQRFDGVEIVDRGKRVDNRCSGKNERRDVDHSAGPCLRRREDHNRMPKAPATPDRMPQRMGTALKFGAAFAVGS